MAPYSLDDSFNLERFIESQKKIYQTAFAEIKAGRKRTHWMWYIFPQLDGLGHSPTAKFYAIKSLAEAEAYLEHPLLASRYMECSHTLLSHKNVSAQQIFGFPDVLKLHSSMTLFSLTPNAPPPVQQVLDSYFSGEQDANTINLL